MPTQTLRPDASSTVDNMVGDYTDVDESVDSIDGNWISCYQNENNSAATLWFPQPTGILKTGTATGVLRIYVQSQDSVETQTFSIRAYEGTTDRGIIGTQDVGANASLLKNFSFNQNVFSDLTAPDIRFRFTSVQSYLDIHAIEWVAELDINVPVKLHHYRTMKAA